MKNDKFADIEQKIMMVRGKRHKIIVVKQNDDDKWHREEIESSTKNVMIKHDEAIKLLANM
ncbi:TPA: hypothetical protein ACF5BV_004184 [Vibrio parahaemolyticus]|uniref:hypothetical protein n=1 Tax=Vibrio parahaemolyticus TaxID=670 RepID=UPI00111DEC2A|nr:hypothetical protein [Vibrio parahaemolyticus]MCZ6314204.1 hypothetical protein [Vibrio parahaemolyticus]TOK18301.1 hypothetical protein CGI23_24360 [Vibrio parahaemolyticus]